MDIPVQFLVKAFLFRIDGTRRLSLVPDNHRYIRYRTLDEGSFQAALAVFSLHSKRLYNAGGLRILPLRWNPPGGASSAPNSPSGTSLQAPTLG
jgi:hypothetical protein